MARIRRGCVAIAVAILVTLGSAFAERSSSTQPRIADINAAFDAGTLTSESLMQMCLARIDAFDRKGPSFHAVITLNPKALEQARALDAERKAKGRRSPLHGIPVVLKDNFDTFDMPTTGGSVLLEGSIPSKDAFVVKKLRDAGAIILAKVNMSEFASGGTYSSLGGQSLNPHDLREAVGIVRRHRRRGRRWVRADRPGDRYRRIDSRAGDGERHRRAEADAGLLSRSGIIPLALSFDTGGPMARSVYDVAAALGDHDRHRRGRLGNEKSDGKFQTDYAKSLSADALKGARIGIARDFPRRRSRCGLGDRGGVRRDARRARRWSTSSYPKWLLDAKGGVLPDDAVSGVHRADRGVSQRHRAEVSENARRDDRRANQFNGTRGDGARPNPSRWTLFKRELESNPMDDYRYKAVHDYGLPMVRAVVEGMLDAQQLDAIVYPTTSRRPSLIAARPARARRVGSALSASGLAASNIANLTGFPDLIVPAGFTGDSLPVGLVVPGPRVQRGETVVDRVQLRTGDESAPASGAHTGAARRGRGETMTRIHFRDVRCCTSCESPSSCGSESGASRPAARRQAGQHHLRGMSVSVSELVPAAHALRAGRADRVHGCAAATARPTGTRSCFSTATTSPGSTSADRSMCCGRPDSASSSPIRSGTGDRRSRSFRTTFTTWRATRGRSCRRSRSSA